MERKMRTYTVKFYREMLCEIDLCAGSVDEAEQLFREGYFLDSCRRVEGSEVVDEVVGIEVCPESMKQIELLN